MAAVTLTPRNHLEAVPEVSPAEALDMTEMVNQLRDSQAREDKRVKSIKIATAIVTIAVCVAIVAAAIFAAIATAHPGIILVGISVCVMTVPLALCVYLSLIVGRCVYPKDEYDYEEQNPYDPTKWGRAADAIQTEGFQNFLTRNKLAPTQANILDLHELYEERGNILWRQSAFLRRKSEGGWLGGAPSLRFHRMTPDFEELQAKIRKAGGVPQPDLGIKQDLAGVE